MRTIMAQPKRLETAEFMSTKTPAAEPRFERITITKARSMIGQLVNRVHTEKDRFVLEKSGIPVAALIDIDEYRQFLAFREAAGAK